MEQHRQICTSTSGAAAAPYHDALVNKNEKRIVLDHSSQHPKNIYPGTYSCNWGRPKKSSLAGNRRMQLEVQEQKYGKAGMTKLRESLDMDNSTKSCKPIVRDFMRFFFLGALTLHSIGKQHSFYTPSKIDSSQCHPCLSLELDETSQTKIKVLQRRTTSRTHQPCTAERM